MNIERYRGIPFVTIRRVKEPTTKERNADTTPYPMNPYLRKIKGLVFAIKDIEDDSLFSSTDNLVFALECPKNRQTIQCIVFTKNFEMRASLNAKLSISELKRFPVTVVGDYHESNGRMYVEYIQICDYEEIIKK